MKNKLSTLIYFILGTITLNYTAMNLLNIIPLNDWLIHLYMCWGAILYHLLILKED